MYPYIYFLKWHLLAYCSSLFTCLLFKPVLTRLLTLRLCSFHTSVAITSFISVLLSVYYISLSMSLFFPPLVPSCYISRFLLGSLFPSHLASLHSSSAFMFFPLEISPFPHTYSLVAPFFFSHALCFYSLLHIFRGIHFAPSTSSHLASVFP